MLMLRSSNQLKLDNADKVCQDVCVVKRVCDGRTVKQTECEESLPKKQSQLYIFMKKYCYAC